MILIFFINLTIAHNLQQKCLFPYNLNGKINQTCMNLCLNQDKAKNILLNHNGKSGGNMACINENAVLDLCNALVKTKNSGLTLTDCNKLKKIPSYLNTNISKLSNNNLISKPNLNTALLGNKLDKITQNKPVIDLNNLNSNFYNKNIPNYTNNIEKLGLSNNFNFQKSNLIDKSHYSNNLNNNSIDILGNKLQYPNNLVNHNNADVPELLTKTVTIFKTIYNTSPEKITSYIDYPPVTLTEKAKTLILTQPANTLLKTITEPGKNLPPITITMTKILGSPGSDSIVTIMQPPHISYVTKTMPPVTVMRPGTTLLIATTTALAPITKAIQIPRYITSTYTTTVLIHEPVSTEFRTVTQAGYKNMLVDPTTQINTVVEPTKNLNNENLNQNIQNANLDETSLNYLRDKRYAERYNNSLDTFGDNNFNNISRKLNGEYMLNNNEIRTGSIDANAMSKASMNDMSKIAEMEAIKSLENESVKIKSEDYSKLGEIQRSKAEEIARSKAEEIARAKAEEIARAKAEEIARAKAEEIARAKAEEIARAKAEEIARAKAEEVARAKAEEIARAKAEEVARAKAEEIARAKAEEIARAKAEEVARAKAEEIARAKAEEIARAKAEEVARAKAEEVARAKAEEIAKAKAEEIQRSKAEEIARAKVKEIFRVKAEEMARVKLNEMIKEKTDEMIKEKTDEMIKAKTDEMIKAKTDEMIKAKTDEMIKAKTDEMIKARDKLMVDESANFLQNNTSKSLINEVSPITPDIMIHKLNESLAKSQLSQTVANEEAIKAAIANEDISKAAISNEDIAKAAMANEEVAKAAIANENVAKAAMANEEAVKAAIANEEAVKAVMANEEAVKAAIMISVNEALGKTTGNEIGANNVLLDNEPCNISLNSLGCVNPNLISKNNLQANNINDSNMMSSNGNQVRLDSNESKLNKQLFTKNEVPYGHLVNDANSSKLVPEGTVPFVPAVDFSIPNGSIPYIPNKLTNETSDKSVSGGPSYGINQDVNNYYGSNTDPSNPMSSLPSCNYSQKGSILPECLSEGILLSQICNINHNNSPDGLLNCVLNTLNLKKSSSNNNITDLKSGNDNIDSSTNLLDNSQNSNPIQILCNSVLKTEAFCKKLTTQLIQEASEMEKVGLSSLLDPKSQLNTIPQSNSPQLNTIPQSNSDNNIKKENNVVFLSELIKP